MAQYKYQVKKGVKWMVKFNYSDPKTGKTKTEYKRGFESKREAREYEDEFLENLTADSGEEDPLYERTFEDVFHEYLMSHKREDIKDSTLQTKYNIFEKHIFPTFRNVLISEITDDDIAEWQAKMKNFVMPNGKHFSKSFLRTIQSQFNSIINYANSKGYLHQNPLADIKNMGIKDKRVEFWSTSEYERFAYYDLEQAVIYVNKTYQRFHRQDIISTPKTPSSVRKVSMPAFLCDELREYIDMLYFPAPDQRIFTITKSKLTNRFHKLSEEAGLRRITVHGLRHSHVSLLISKKYDIFEVSKRIGHKSIKTTQDIYGHLFDEVQKTIANDLDSLRRR